MNINNLSKAAFIQQKMLKLEEQFRIAANKSGGLGITIQGSYQDDSFVEAIRPSVLAELNGRIGVEKDALAELGITF